MVVGGSCSPESHGGRSHEGQAQAASHPVQCCAVLLVLFLRDECCKSLVGCHCCWSHASRGAENKRSEGSVFNFLNTFFICPSLLSFLPFVALAECKCSVRLRKWVENS